jgi:O-acetylserine/cysteine efflux transporter
MASNVGALAIAGQLSVPFSLLLGALLLGEKLNGQAWNGLMGVVTLARFALMFERPAIAGLVHVGWVTMAWFGFSSLGATIVGQGTLAWLLQRYPISTIMPLMLASPVISTVFASLYFTTPITAVMIGGGTVALIGVAIIALSPDRKSAPFVDGKG